MWPSAHTERHRLAQSVLRRGLGVLTAGKRDSMASPCNLLLLHQLILQPAAPLQQGTE